MLSVRYVFNVRNIRPSLRLTETHRTSPSRINRTGRTNLIYALKWEGERDGETDEVRGGGQHSVTAGGRSTCHKLGEIYAAC